MRPVRCESGYAKTEHIFGTPTFLAATQALVLSEQGLKGVAPLIVSGPPRGRNDDDDEDDEGPMIP